MIIQLLVSVAPPETMGKQGGRGKLEQQRVLHFEKRHTQRAARLVRLIKDRATHDTGSGQSSLRGRGKGPANAWGPLSPATPEDAQIFYMFCVTLM